MPEIIVTLREGGERRIETRSGISVMEAIRNAGVGEIQALCGGCAACCTCHVYVDPEMIDQEIRSRVPPITDQENDLLDSSDARTDSSRLACQIEISDALDGLRVTIAPEE